MLWFGDLNYRITMPLTEALARSKTGTVEDMEVLLQYDQVSV